jgi:hypothetical protein
MERNTNRPAQAAGIAVDVVETGAVAWGAKEVVRGIRNEDFGVALIGLIVASAGSALKFNVLRKEHRRSFHSHYHLPVNAGDPHFLRPRTHRGRPTTR